jgi:smad nuclear-interacting protein 1
LHLHRQSGFLIGREKKVADIHMEHESVSAQHAVIQFRMRVVEQRESELDSVEYIQQINPYIMDLKSTHHTFLNGKQIEHSRYIELKEKDVLKFGGSTREYVLMKATDD